MYYKPMYDALTDQWHINEIETKQGPCCFSTKEEAEQFIANYKD